MKSNQAPCPRCSKLVSRKNMSHHLKRCGNKKHTIEPQRPCASCGTMVTLSNFNRHLKKCSPASLKRKNGDSVPSTSKTPRLDDSDPQPSTSSSIMDTVRSSVISTFNSIKSTLGNLVVGEGDILQIKETEKAFKGRMKTYTIENKPNIKDPIIFLNKARNLIVEKITEIVLEQNIKANFVFLVEFKKPINDKFEFKEMNFKTKNTTILPTTKIDDYVKEAEKKILTEMEDFQAKGSGWTLHKVISLELAINRYLPIRGSTYIDLPSKIKAKTAILNIQNNDQKCFLWSVIAALHPVDWKDHPYRLHHYLPFEQELVCHFDNISFPVSLDHIKLFEKRSNISISVYCYNDKYHINPLLVTDKERSKHVDLLYITEQNNTHYCLIKDLERLVSSQISNHQHKLWICKRCLQHFGREDLLNKHKEYCNQHDAMKIEMPKEGSTLKFKKFQNSMRVPFVAYADFECMLTPVSPEENQAIGPERCYTDKYQKHEAISFSYYIVYSEGDRERPCNYFGSDTAQVFVEHLLHESRKIYYLYSSQAAIPMQLTQEDLENIIIAQHCHICGEPFEEDNEKVRDHDHLTGKFRGVAHNSCNLNYKKPKFIPVFIHNLSGYDTHLFIKMFGLNNETINVIPNNEERYISFTVNVEGGLQLRFLDSCRFMSSSLDSLVQNLAPDQFRHTAKFYSGDQLKLLQKKGVYPYDFMDSLDKFELISLPQKKEFYNRLKMEDIKDKDYEHALNVWNTFNITDMKEYTLLYNQTDVLLLADVMENFRDVCMNTYKLDPAWYFTAPGLAWDAMLKTTAIELQLLTDYDMVLMIGEGIRGGISQCSHRYAKANNPYMQDYDEGKPSTYLMYLDANNLYGWAMSQYIPYGDFKWEEDTNIDITQIPDNHPTGYILEVDLEYPQELHDHHSDFPLAPERRSPPGSTQKKLLTTLFEKKKYVVHYRNLKLYLSLGMRLRRIHRMISFSQKDWLRTYIDLNTHMRTQAKNEFEKDFFKLMNNSVFGKTMENIRNRVDIRLATQDKQVEKWMAKPNFKHRTIFTEQLAAIHMSKTRLLFDKAIYVGMSILDISKTLMYEFHFNIMKKRYGDKAKVQYTDTDSLTYLIETPNFYNDMKEMIEFFDTSDYPNPNRYNMPRVNKKVLGKMKDELNGRIMNEHVGLRSKMYASQSERKDNKDDGTIKKSKGVKKSVVKDHLTFQDYKDCLSDRADRYCSMNIIRSYHHDLYSVELNKVSLSAHDDKRYIKEDGISTLPWGHYSISEDTMLDLAIQEALMAK